MEQPKRTLERADSEPASKRKPLSCLACKKKPLTNGDWAAYDKKGRMHSAIGDRCSACEAVWTKTFCYLTWESFAKLQESEETGVIGILEGR